MTKGKNTLLWIKNIALVCTMMSIWWLAAKMARLLMMFNSGGTQVLSEAEWQKMKSFSALDKTMIVIFLVSVIVVIITNKIRRKIK